VKSKKGCDMQDRDHYRRMIELGMLTLAVPTLSYWVYLLLSY
jgi:hypothetical protein